MKQFVIALLLASCNGIRLTTEGAPAKAPETRYVPYSYPGLKGFNIQTLEHCPDFNERMTLLDGKTKAVSYPQPGFNCNADYGLAQGGPNTAAPGAGKGETRFVLHNHPGLKGFNINTLEHCPDFNERMTLLDGKTKAVSYPQPGFNCNADYGLAQGGPNTAAPGTKGEDRFVLHNHPGLKGFDISTLEHCPDFNERMTLLNGKTKAVSYPNPGFNCNADYGLAQGGPNTAAPGTKGEARYVMPVYAGLKGFDIHTLEHCPDFNERMTLLDGKTKAVSYPQPGFNCNADYGLSQGGPNTPAPGVKGGETRYVMPVYPGLKGFDITKLEHCPDFNERMTLLDGKTKGVAYPKPGFNCNADYGMAQNKK